MNYLEFKALFNEEKNVARDMLLRVMPDADLPWFFSELFEAACTGYPCKNPLLNPKLWLRQITCKVIVKFVVFGRQNPDHN